MPFLLRLKKNMLKFQALIDQNFGIVEFSACMPEY